MYICMHISNQLFVCLSTYPFLHGYIHTYLPTYLPTYLRTYVPTYVQTSLRDCRKHLAVGDRGMAYIRNEKANRFEGMKILRFKVQRLQHKSYLESQGDLVSILIVRRQILTAVIPTLDHLLNPPTPKS